MIRNWTHSFGLHFASKKGGERKHFCLSSCSHLCVSLPKAILVLHYLIIRAINEKPNDKRSFGDEDADARRQMKERIG